MRMRAVPTPVGYTASSRTLAVATGARHEVGSAARAWAGSRALFEGAGRGARHARRALDGEHSRAHSQSGLYGAIDDFISRNFWFFFLLSVRFEDLNIWTRLKSELFMTVAADRLGGPSSWG